jgi:2',3'-cyclic-nucleotide 2'-phosphodiesterase
MQIEILLIGDVVGKPGRDILARVLPGYVASEKIDFVIANGENAAQGSGITSSLFKELLASGIDLVTLGDHTWRRKEAIPVLEKDQSILRPLNYPPECVGRGMGTYRTRSGVRIDVVVLLGRIFMEPVDCPFHGIDNALKILGGDARVIFVEVHAEATSEKMALGWKLAGRVSCVFGTHTHVQTADERILPGGTAYITDLGMTGPYDSVIGRDKESVLFKCQTAMHAPFTVAQNDVRIAGARVRVDSETGKALEIQRVFLK